MKMTYIVVVFFAMFFIACFDEYDENNLQKKCEATPCLDSLCMHWNSELKRCGTESALRVELERKNNEIQRKTSKRNDSLYKKYVEIMSEQNNRLDTLTKEIEMLIIKNEFYEKKMDSLLILTRKRNFCDKIKKCQSVVDSVKNRSIVFHKDSLKLKECASFVYLIKRSILDQCNQKVN